MGEKRKLVAYVTGLQWLDAVKTVLLNEGWVFTLWDFVYFPE
jgi:hypothetical protein